MIALLVRLSKSSAEIHSIELVSLLSVRIEKLLTMNFSILSKYKKTVR